MTALRRAMPAVWAMVLAVVAVWVMPAPAGARVFPPGSSGGGDPYFPLQGNGGYDVQHYDVTFSYDPGAKRMVGSTSISAVTTQDLGRFDLDLLGLSVRDVVVNGAAATFSRQGQELVVTPRTGVLSGQPLNVSVAYDGSPSPVIDPDGTPDGWIVTDDGAFVAGEPQGAMTWFPGNHGLRDKATHRFTVTVPDGTTAVGNGNLVSRSSAGGQTTFVWDSTEPMADYLATATIGRFDLTVTQAPTGTNYVAVDPRVGSAASGPVAQTGDVVAYFAGLFGPYPFSVTGGIVDYAPSVGYALETQTKPLYSLPPDSSLVAHELAHQWYGDSVTPSAWRDVWLNEGFATYSEWMWGEHTGGPSVQQKFDAAYSPPAGSSFWQVRPGDPGAPSLFHSAVYERGAMALHALRATVGTRTFFRILQAWASEHRYGNGTTEQLIALAERLSGRQLGPLFQRWLYDAGKPAFP